MAESPLPYRAFCPHRSGGTPFARCGPARSRGTVLRCSAALGGGLYPIGRTFLSGKKGVPHKEEAFFIAFIFDPFPMPKPLLPAVLARLPDGFGGKLHSCAKRVAFSPYWRPDEAYSPAPP